MSVGRRRSPWVARAPWLVPLCAMTVPWPLSIPLGDVIMFMLGLYGFFLFAGDRTVTVPPIAARYALTIGALIVGATVMAASRTSLIPQTNVFSLLVKSAMVVGAVILVWSAGDPRSVRRHLEAAIVLLGVAHVGLALLLLVADRAGLPLPVTGRGFPLGVTEQFGFAGGRIARPHGLFAEPSDFASFSAIALTIAAIRDEQRAWVLRTLAIGSVLSLSISGFAIAVLGVALSGRHRELVPRMLGLGRLDALITIPVTVIMFAVLAPTLVDPIENFVVGRSQAIVDGGDQSTGGRISGSFQTAAAGVNENPIIGSGYGYLGPVADRAGAFDEWTTVGTDTGFNWNLTLFLVGSGGLIALLPWLGVLHEAALAGRQVLVPFLAWSSTTSNIAGGFLCLMLLWVGTNAACASRDRRLTGALT